MVFGIADHSFRLKKVGGWGKRLFPGYNSQIR
jgi:hypothetical protein